MKSEKLAPLVAVALTAGVVMAPLDPLFSCFTQGTGPCVNQIVTGAISGPAAATPAPPPSSAAVPPNAQSGGN